MTDFESSMLSALSQIYPGIRQEGCLFYLAKNDFRRVQDIGLQQNYLTDPLFRGIIRIIPALSSVPVHDLIYIYFFLFITLRRYRFLIYKFTNSTMNINSYTN